MNLSYVREMFRGIRKDDFLKRDFRHKSSPAMVRSLCSHLRVSFPSDTTAKLSAITDDTCGAGIDASMDYNQ